MMVNEKQMKKIEELAMPLVNFLRDNFHPYVTIVIAPNRISLEETQLWVPVIDDAD